MNLDSYKTWALGKAIDFDHAYGAQCVDLVNDYVTKLCQAGRFSGNAKDIFGQEPSLFNWVRNTPNGVPPAGSIFVYGSSWGGGYGHTAIVLAADVNTVTLLEQNDGHPYVTIGVHNYSGAIGWGIPVHNPAVVVSGGGRYQAVTPAYVRSAPHLWAPLSGSRELLVGEWFDAAGQVGGDVVSGNGTWIKSLRGNYVWSGNLKRIG